MEEGLICTIRGVPRMRQTPMEAMIVVEGQISW